MSDASREANPSSRLHVAIIMDGNGRWATGRGLPRTAGHMAGAGAVRRTVEAAVAHGIGWLTLFAFSSDNWHRPPQEVATLLALFADYLEAEVETCRRHGIRLGVIGRRDRLGLRLGHLVERAEQLTRGGTALHLRLAIDYSGRGAILRAARRVRQAGNFTEDAFARCLGEVDFGHDECPGMGDTPNVDLLIRTGGEQRLSDFLLWESAYAELVFLDRMWPDFQASDLEAALSEFRGRDRRFGRVSDQLAL